jgi:cobalt/nickel transport protein
MTTTKKLWIGIGILALLSPLGLIIPTLFGAGGAWGEWSAEEFSKLVGYVPEGMRKLAHLWKSPLKDYAVPGQAQGLARRGLDYVLTAFIGVALAAGLAYLIACVLGRKNREK